MSWLYGAERVFSYLNLAATLSLIIRLIWIQLFRVYRCLFVYLIVDATQTLVGLGVAQINLNVYGWIYFGGQLIKTGLAVMVVLEVYRIALAGHPGLAQFGRNTVSYALSGAALVAACGIILDRSVPPGQSRLLHWLNTFERTMDAAMVIFLVGVTLFLTWFPVRLKRNAILYIGGFVVYFLSRSAGLLWLNLEPERRRVLGIAMVGAGFICLTVWLITFQRHGEEATAVTGHRWDPGAAERLTGQLNEINAWLLRVSRRAGQ